MPKFVFLWSDAVVLAIPLLLLAYALRVRRSPNLRGIWRRVLQDRAAICSALVLLVFLAVAVADSLHFRRLLTEVRTATGTSLRAYSTRTESLLDVLLTRLVQGRETSYSAPLAMRGYTKDTVLLADGRTTRTYPRLAHGGERLAGDADRLGDGLSRAALGLVGGAAAAIAAFALAAAALAAGAHRPFATAWRDLATDRTRLPWRAAWVTFAVLALFAGPIAALALHYHVFGTDRTGNDVLYQALKSIRTAFVIGTLSTIATLPLAVGLGIAAGYLRGWVDEAVQYLYTLLSSIPNVLLIAACVLMMQVFIDSHPDLFETGAERADVRLFLLCVILGLTGWATLCRLLRAETMKIAQLEYVQAATAFGLRAGPIMARHVFPNVVHLIIITTVLDFSALILYEAVLSFVGVGVDPSMNSFGGMINLARTEMSRDPVVWWAFVAAFVFMVALVLAANLFADGVRDAFDPRARVPRPRLARRNPAAARESTVAGTRPSPAPGGGAP